MERLRETAATHPIIGDGRGKGLMIGVELVRDRQTKEPAPAEAAAVRRFCREHGVLIGVGGQNANVVRIQPPLVISQERLSGALDVLERALESIAVEV